ncbi:hypothetical protein GWO43_19955 [candidate division KSB1 bacterium]|nr:hypothetical protein [candidate division KSB1 bacterium]NIR71546.1 hypothetical protein [candidate division KSB1 bacterium]NIS26342.1 hypothetical protein [candidate division KSB1 bacterium]NIT73109.1 hypothetical protein [candidate division KSB1 bacterium]NIU27025.1 hypothetical protein [candidate division KSB1 bacterium]
MKEQRLVLTIIVFFMLITNVIAQISNEAITTNTEDQSETAIAISPVNSDYLFGAWNDFRGVTFLGQTPGGSEPPGVKRSDVTFWTP